MKIETKKSILTYYLFLTFMKVEIKYYYDNNTNTFIY